MLLDGQRPEVADIGQRPRGLGSEEEVGGVRPEPGLVPPGRGHNTQDVFTVAVGP